MGRVIFLFLFCQSSGLILSQNLVPNYDFSEVITCDEDTTAYSKQAEYLTHWFNPPFGADSLRYPYFEFWHQCKTSAWHRPSSTWWRERVPGFVSNMVPGYNCADTVRFAFPNTVSGKGMISLHLLDTIERTFWLSFYNDDCNRLDSIYTTIYYHGQRHFAEVALLNQLVSGTEYTIEFHTYIDYQGPKYYPSYAATNSIGAYVHSDTFYISDYRKNQITPQVESDQIIYKKEWKKVSGSFIANGNEQFLTLGNFKPDSLTDLLWLPRDTSGSPFVFCHYYFDAIYLYKSTDTLFNLSLPPDTTLCPGESLTLIPELDDGFKLEDTTKTWLWSTGSTDSVITVSEPGTYWVKVTYNERWWDSDTLVIHPYEAYESGLPPDTLVCEEREFNLRVPMNPDIGLQWNTGNRRFTQPVEPPGGWYWITYEDECGTHYDSSFVEFQECDTNQAPVLYIPNSFSPNGDGLNDQWRIANLPKENEVWIFNRWGELVFTQKNYDGTWEGLDLGGAPLRQGIYVFRIRYRYYPGVESEEMGSVQIMR